MPNVIGVLDRANKRIGKGTARLGDKKTSGDHPNYSIVKIGQNTMKNKGAGGDLFHTDSSGKSSANAGVKNSEKCKIIIWRFAGHLLTWKKRAHTTVDKGSDDEAPGLTPARFYRNTLCVKERRKKGTCQHWGLH